MESNMKITLTKIVLTLIDRRKEGLKYCNSMDVKGISLLKLKICLLSCTRFYEVGFVRNPLSSEVVSDSYTYL